MAVRLIPSDIKGLKFAEQVSWAAGDPGSGYTAVKAWDVDFKPSVNIIVPPFQKPEGCRGPDTPIVAGKGGTLTFKTYMRGGAGSETIFSKLAKNMGLNRVAYGNETVAAGSTSSTLKITSTALEPGDGVCVNVSGDRQLRWVSDLTDANTTDTEPNWTTTPSASDTTNDSDTFYPVGTSLGEPTKYMTFKLYEGTGTTDRHLWSLTGCAGTFKIATSEANTVPVLEWTYQVDSFAATESNTTVTADAYNPANPLLGDPFFVDDTQTKVRSFGFDPGLKLVPYTTTEGSEGRSGWLYVGTEPKVEVELMHDNDFVKAAGNWLTPTAVQLSFTSIKDADEFWGFHAPKAYILDAGPQDVNEHRGFKPEWVLCDPGTATTDGDNIPLWAITVSGSGS